MFNLRIQPRQARSMINKLLFFLFTLIPILYASAQDTGNKRTYETQHIGSLPAPNIDAVLDEAAWDLVEWSGQYTEFEPDVGTDPSEQTYMKVIYDNKNIYVAFKCMQSNMDVLEKRMGRRDDFPGDWVEINLDSYNDDRSAFSFTLSVSGVKGDEFVSNNGNFDDSWNPIWYAKTRIGEEAWFAEFRVPLSQLRFSSEDEQVWGLQSTRRYFPNEERSVWQPLEANPVGWVSEFGELRGLKGIKPQKQLEVQPYVVSQLDRYPAVEGSPFEDGSDAQVTAGLDAKIGITNDLTLDLTINPDFGQVDADPGAIALDGFEIFFQERRPFFVENKNIFDFRAGGGADNLFFSRRIGRQPQSVTSVDSGKGEFEDIPVATRILGAAKFSGKTKKGWAIGILESVTQKTFGRIELDTREDVLAQLDERGTERKELVEPLTNYFTTRVQKDFNDRNSFIGGIFTSTNRMMEPNVDFLHEEAYSGGLDFRHNWNNRKYFVDGNVYFSQVTGSPEALLRTQNSLTHLFQRTDADHVSVDSTLTSLTGNGGRIEIGRGGGGNWRYNAGAIWKSPGLELNDIGFLRQADIIRQYASVTRLYNKPTNWYRQANLSLEQSTEFDYQGNYNRFQLEGEGFINYKNNWWSEMGFGYKPRIFSNTMLRGGPRWKWNDENFVYLFSGTDRRKKFSTTLGIVYSRAAENQFTFNRYVWRMNYQPTDRLSANMEITFQSNPNKTQYVTESAFGSEARYIMAEIENTSLTPTLRLNYSFNPNLTLQYYGQPFIFKAQYSNFNYVTTAAADKLADRVSWYSNDQISFQDGTYHIDENRDGNTDYSLNDPDFAFMQFRSNMVLRWEYIPGSEIFAVWSQGITGFGDLNRNVFQLVTNDLFNSGPENTFLLKATYRFVK